MGQQSGSNRNFILQKCADSAPEFKVLIEAPETV